MRTRWRIRRASLESRGIERRSFISGSLSCSLLYGCGVDLFPEGSSKRPKPEEDDDVDTLEEEWEFRAKNYENAAIVKSRDNPGDSSEEVVRGHIPEVTWGSDLVAVHLDHDMSSDHFIMSIYIKDQNNKVIGFRDFVPLMDSRAWVAFGLPKKTSIVMAYVFCNKHLHWCERYDRPHF